MDSRLKFIEYKEKKIFVEDFSGMHPGEEFDSLVNEAKVAIHSQPEKSVLAMFNASKIRFDSPMINGFQSFVNSNKDFVKAVGVIGIDGLLSIVLNSLSRVSGRNFRTFTTQEEAFEWLANQ
jgi:hypothetical protein